MVIQHMAGYPVDGEELSAAAGISPSNIVEDAAHGLGATVRGTLVGAGVRAACFSFYATKNLPIGEGGAITTNDGELADRLRRMRLHGMSGDAWRRYQPGASWRYTVTEPGMKANFTDIQGAIGRAQLHYLDGWQKRRAEIAQLYGEQLADIRGIELPPRPIAEQHAWHLYIVRIQPEFGMHRDAVVEALAGRGIGTSVHFIPIHHQPYFRSLLGADQCERLPVADAVFPEILSLPLHPGLSNREIARVCTVLRDLSNR
jgi:perosamine synthetase